MAAHRLTGSNRSVEGWEARLREYEEQAAILRKIIVADHPPRADQAA